MSESGETNQKLRWYERLFMQLFIMVFLILPLGVGGWMTILSTHETYWSWTATNWPITEGSITKSETSTSGGSRLRTSSGLHDAHIEYTYEVNGSVFTSDRFSFNTPSRSFASNAQSIL